MNYSKKTKIEKKENIHYFIKLFNDKKFKKLIDEGEKYLNNFCLNSDLISLIGDSYFFIKNYNNSLRYYLKAIDVKKNSQILHNIGIIYKIKKKYDLAIKYLKDSIFLNPEYMYSYTSLSKLYIEINQLPNAKKTIKKAINFYPNEVLPYLIYGNILFTENYYIKAINNFKKALKIEKNNVDALTNLAKIYRELNQYNESLYYISILIRINKMNYEIYETLGNIYFDLDKYEDAKKSYLKSIELNKENFQSYQNLGILQLYQGDFKNGWYNYDFKWDNKIYYSNRPNFSVPKWNLNSHCHVFVWKQEGIGDQILYSRLFNDLRDKDIKIDALVDKKLKPLFQSSFPHINFVDETYQNIVNYHIPMGDLGQFFIRF